MTEKPKPTKDEARNGWTPEQLQEYLRKRTTEQQRSLDPVTRPAIKPATANNRYKPHHWR